MHTDVEILIKLSKKQTKTKSNISHIITVKKQNQTPSVTPSASTYTHTHHAIPYVLDSVYHENNHYLPTNWYRLTWGHLSSN